MRLQLINETDRRRGTVNSRLIRLPCAASVTNGRSVTARCIGRRPPRPVEVEVAVSALIV